MFSGTDVPACGFSLGLERILVVMQERGMFPPHVVQASVDVVVAAMDETAQPAAMESAAGHFRSAPEAIRFVAWRDWVAAVSNVFALADSGWASAARLLPGPVKR
jgi:histidyl-tRNA synthetase